MKKKLLVALTVVLLTFASVPVMAANSPATNPVYSITIGDQTVGKNGASGIKVDGGKISVSTGAVSVGEEVTLTATADKGYKFSKWVIDGDYTIVSGSLTSKTITIIPNADLNINAKFVDANGKEPETEIKKPDNSGTSPKTGAAAGAILITLLASGGVAVTSRKKFSK